MASFADLYQADQGTPLGFSLAGINDQMGDARTDAGLQKSQNSLMYSRALTNLTNDYSAKGTARGGMAGVAGDQLGQDYAYGQGSTDMMLNRTLANLSRNKILATYGLMF